MRNAVLPVSRQITSSRQSPKRSALKQGVDLVPLLDATELSVSRFVSPLVPYLSIWLLSSSSRTVSASHQIRKLVEPGFRPTLLPELLLMPLTAEDHASAPALPAQTSPATPRPLSQPQVGCDQMIAPVRASYM